MSVRLGMIARGNIPTVEQVDAGFQLDGSGCGSAGSTYLVDSEKCLMNEIRFFSFVNDDSMRYASII